jgi:hypothetical protein
MNPQKSRFANPESLRIQAGGLANLKDLYRRFDLQTFFQKICILDLIHKAKNLKLLDLFQFGRIRVRIPHLY